MVIHVIGTVNGQVNEGMRNVATHLAKEFEKENTVLYSGLKQIPQIVLNSKRADVTMIFARANKLVYGLASIVTRVCKNTWIVLPPPNITGLLKRGYCSGYTRFHVQNIFIPTSFTGKFKS